MQPGGSQSPTHLVGDTNERPPDPAQGRARRRRLTVQPATKSETDGTTAPDDNTGQSNDDFQW
jgi:hypothetical protein